MNHETAKIFKRENFPLYGTFNCERHTIRIFPHPVVLVSACFNAKLHVHDASLDVNLPNLEPRLVID